MYAKRILSAILAAVLSLSVLVSCASDDSGQTGDTTPAVTADTEPTAETTEPVPETTTAREEAKDNVPETLRFDGQTSTWYTETKTRI